jgi:hypothetical protein
MKTITLVSAIVLGASLAGCVTPPAQQTPAASLPPGQVLSSSPDLSPYVRIELYAQGSGASEPPVQLRSQFAGGQAQFEVTRTDGTSAGRLHVQPDDCRDDANAACKRRFTINGRLQAFGANLSCVVPVRNDANVGYGSQTLSGLCQSQYGRAYTLQMFPR